MGVVRTVRIEDCGEGRRGSFPRRREGTTQEGGPASGRRPGRNTRQSKRQEDCMWVDYETSSTRGVAPWCGDLGRPVAGWATYGGGACPSGPGLRSSRQRGRPRTPMPGRDPAGLREPFDETQGRHRKGDGYRQGYRTEHITVQRIVAETTQVARKYTVMRRSTRHKPTSASTRG